MTKTEETQSIEWRLRKPRKPDEFDNSSGFALAERTYQKAGRSWPRLAISVCQDHLHQEMNSLVLTVSRKNNPGAFWEEAGLPLPLVGVACDLLAEAAKKVANKGAET
jgi:hypothetical protein